MLILFPVDELVHPAISSFWIFEKYQGSFFVNIIDEFKCLIHSQLFCKTEFSRSLQDTTFSPNICQAKSTQKNDLPDHFLKIRFAIFHSAPATIESHTAVASPPVS